MGSILTECILLVRERNGLFSCVKTEEEKAQDRELAILDEIRRAY